MTSYTASAAWIGDNVIDTACQDGAPPIVRDVAELLGDVLAEHRDVPALTVSVDVAQ